MADERPPGRLNDEDEQERGGGLRGKLEEMAGWATGDRELEARGRVRRLGDEVGDGEDSEGSDDAEVADTVAEAERQLRIERGELDPEAARRAHE